MDLPLGPLRLRPRRDYVVIGASLAGVAAAVALALVLPALATPPFFIVVALLMICAGQTALLALLRRSLRDRYLCGGPPAIGGVWICPLLATGRTQATQPRLPAAEVTLHGMVPLAVQQSAVVPRVTTPRASVGQALVESPTLRILVIEDEAVSRHIMSATLQGAGHTVHQADDGAQGLYLLGAEHPDVVVLDLNLPTVSGQEIARAKAQIEAQQGHRARVVVVTVDADAAQEAHALGADAFLIKPVTGEQLVHTVESVAKKANGEQASHGGAKGASSHGSQDDDPHATSASPNR